MGIGSRNSELALMATEVARLAEVMRLRDPHSAESSEILRGIQRQLAAAEANHAAMTVDVPKLSKSAAGKSDEKAGKNKDGKTSKSDKADKAGKASKSDKSKRQQPAKAKQLKGRKKLIQQLQEDMQTIQLMLISPEVTSEQASKSFDELRRSVIEAASQRRNHLADLAFVHSILHAAQEAAAADSAAETDQTGETDETDSADETDQSDKASKKGKTVKAGKADTADQPSEKSQQEKQQQTWSVALREVSERFTRCGGEIVNEYSQDQQDHFQIHGDGKTMSVVRPAYLATNADERVMVIARGTIEAS